MKCTPRALAALLPAALVTASMLAPATAAAPEKLRLSQLDKGAAAAVPFVADGELRDGSVRISLPKGLTRLMGEVPTGYLVQGYSQEQEQELVVRVAAGAPPVVVARGLALSDATLAPDGTSFVASRAQGDLDTVLRRYDATTGAITLRTTLEGYARVLDYDGTVAVVGGIGQVGTALWDVTTDEVSRVSREWAHQADLTADRLARFTGDPYRGGCTIVSALSRPKQVLWRSCEEAVTAFSPDGSRMVTTHILADGLGPSRFTLRRTGGRALGVYEAPAYFGRIHFEDARHVLADTFARTKGAVVRCDAGGCERVTKVYGHRLPVRAAG